MRKGRSKKKCHGSAKRVNRSVTGRFSEIMAKGKSVSSRLSGHKSHHRSIKTSEKNDSPDPSKNPKLKNKSRTTCSPDRRTDSWHRDKAWTTGSPTRNSHHGDRTEHPSSDKKKKSSQKVQLQRNIQIKWEGEDPLIHLVMSEAHAHCYQLVRLLRQRGQEREYLVRITADSPRLMSRNSPDLALGLQSSAPPPNPTNKQNERAAIRNGFQVLMRVREKIGLSTLQLSRLRHNTTAHKLVSRHKNVASLLDTFESRTHYFTILEYVGERTLKNYVHNVRSEANDLYVDDVTLAQREDEAKGIFDNLVRVTRFCHQHGVLINNFSVDNIYLYDGRTVKLTGFESVSSPSVSNSQKDYRSSHELYSRNIDSLRQILQWLTPTRKRIPTHPHTSPREVSSMRQDTSQSEHKDARSAVNIAESEKEQLKKLLQKVVSNTWTQKLTEQISSDIHLEGVIERTSTSEKNDEQPDKYHEEQEKRPVLREVSSNFEDMVENLMKTNISSTCSGKETRPKSEDARDLADEFVLVCLPAPSETKHVKPMAVTKTKGDSLHHGSSQSHIRAERPYSASHGIDRSKSTGEQISNVQPITTKWPCTENLCLENNDKYGAVPHLTIPEDESSHSSHSPLCGSDSEESDLSGQQSRAPRPKGVPSIDLTGVESSEDEDSYCQVKGRSHKLTKADAPRHWGLVKGSNFHKGTRTEYQAIPEMDLSVVGVACKRRTLNTQTNKRSRSTNDARHVSNAQNQDTTNRLLDTSCTPVRTNSAKKKAASIHRIVVPWK